MKSLPSLGSDSITLEVFRNALVGLADEMGIVTVRTSRSTALVLSRDFSTALADERGRIIAQGSNILIHLGTMPDATAVLLRDYAGRIYPGDVFIFNSVDEITQHLPDIYVIRPAFLGTELLGFAICMAHHGDVGGAITGSMAPWSKEIYQEGLQIPLVKLYDRGVRNEEVAAVIRRNVRLPEMVMGDLEGQAAACYVGSMGLIELANRYTLDTLKGLMDEVLDYAERLVRAEIESIPDGEYAFEDWIDDDGAGGGPVRLHVRITVAGSDIDIDWNGSGKQVGAAYNCHLTNTRSITYGALQGVFSDEIPSNAGFYRPITVRAPLGSIVNPRRGAALAQRGVTASRMIDTLLGALAKPLPNRVPAAGDGGVYSVGISGFDEEMRPFQSSAGLVVAGWGGRDGLEGIDGTSPYYTNLAVTPIEVQEADGIVEVEEYAFVTDTGGSGRWRGGLAIGKQLRFLRKEGSAHIRSPRRKFRPYGLCGGLPGTPSQLILNPGPHQRLLPTSGEVALRLGDRLRHVSAGSGGFGDPLLRDPERVLDDVLNQKVSVEHAEAAYGVVINSDGTAIDWIATEARRESIGRRRAHAPGQTSAPRHKRSTEESSADTPTKSDHQSGDGKSAKHSSETSAVQTDLAQRETV